MEPIISPLWIYLINLASTIYAFSIGLFGVSLLIWILVYVEEIEFDGPDSEKVRSRWLKVFAAIMIVCLLMFMLVPDKNTMYAMLAASMITPDNISGGEEHLIDLITKIANIIYNAPKYFFRI